MNFKCDSLPVFSLNPVIDEVYEQIKSKYSAFLEGGDRYHFKLSEREWINLNHIYI